MRTSLAAGWILPSLSSLACALLVATPFAARAGGAYVGQETCLECHEAMSAGLTEHFEQTIHAKVLNEKNALEPWMARGCESCHGPGAEHVRAGGGKGVGGMRSFRGDDPSELAADNATCMKCHQGGHRLYWDGSPHASHDIACTSCHTIMRKVSLRSQLSKSSVTAVCSGCHRVQAARQYRNAHMPVREDKMDCTSCHNPHGTIADKLISATTINDKCYTCHADKRGPFLWEHPPVTENCLNCHDPHGTTRNKMLKVGMPRLCQTCHVATRHPNTPTQAGDRFTVGQACANCHPNFHGSNHPSGNRFTR